MQIKEVLRKTGQAAKAFWGANGISDKEITAKLTYERLEVEQNEPIIGKIKNDVREVLQPVYDKLKDHLASAGKDAIAERMDECLDILVDHVGEFAFSATVQNEVVLRNSGLPEVPASDTSAPAKEVEELGELEF